MTNENILLGTDLKIKVELICEGFSMNDDNFDLTLRWNGGDMTYKKTESSTDEHIVEAQDGSGWYLVIETEKLNMKGLVTLIATLYVPDTDFPDKIRSEVVKQDLFSVKRA
jgi:hypothetical protein